MLGVFFFLGFIGYAPNLKEMISDWSGADSDSDQLFFTKIYINPEKRVSVVFGIDYILSGGNHGVVS